MSDRLLSGTPDQLDYPGLGSFPPTGIADTPHDGYAGGYGTAYGMAGDGGFPSYAGGHDGGASLAGGWGTGTQHADSQGPFGYPATGGFDPDQVTDPLGHPGQADPLAYQDPQTHQQHGYYQGYSGYEQPHQAPNYGEFATGYGTAPGYPTGDPQPVVEPERAAGYDPFGQNGYDAGTGATALVEEWATPGTGAYPGQHDAYPGRHDETGWGAAPVDEAQPTGYGYPGTGVEDTGEQRTFGTAPDEPWAQAAEPERPAEASADPTTAWQSAEDVETPTAADAPEPGHAADRDTDRDTGDDPAPARRPVEVGKPVNRGRRRSPRPRRSALLSVAAPSLAVLGVTAAATAATVNNSESPAEPPPVAAPDPSEVEEIEANEQFDTQLQSLSAAADDYADRASRTQGRMDLEAQIAAEEQAAIEEAARQEELRPKFWLPVEQRGLSAYYGQAGVNWMSTHTGIDFPVSYGTPVMAATDGEVRTQWNPSYGNMLILTAPDGTETWYAHLDSTAYQSGWVQAGTVIAYSGNSGTSTGPHLHFEVRPYGGSAVDPLAWLRNHGLEPT
ncbi:peptidoglycan DD-metalloendopeptidase family protein [Streptomyces sp. DSM 44915]|uniref:Peptidoglycan DD-metalloendopeptidase family protein n=1 Tax=Streptomyces chisholmiae TaxID=3075540 RepID=A0ABU2JJU2_9ACTN|nr:peptidoglycan DD-metalloendopeptidase family protein [Streptomyces sp. DSM 44915]MDT0265250.1 peptidoglycan DD-metalloendopeptidase family protein [Streptomyces sp. DSM 44915]